MPTEWKIGDRLESRWEIHKIMRGGFVCPSRSPRLWRGEKEVQGAFPRWRSSIPPHST